MPRNVRGAVRTELANPETKFVAECKLAEILLAGESYLFLSRLNVKTTASERFKGELAKIVAVFIAPIKIRFLSSSDISVSFYVPLRKACCPSAGGLFSSEPDRYQLSVTSICFGRAFSLLARRTRNTPSLNSAFTSSDLTSSGMLKVRSKRPQ